MFINFNKEPYARIIVDFAIEKTNLPIVDWFMNYDINIINNTIRQEIIDNSKIPKYHFSSDSLDELGYNIILPVDCAGKWHFVPSIKQQDGTTKILYSNIEMLDIEEEGDYYLSLNFTENSGIFGVHWYGGPETKLERTLTAKYLDENKAKKMTWLTNSSVVMDSPKTIQNGYNNLILNDYYISEVEDEEIGTCIKLPFYLYRIHCYPNNMLNLMIVPLVSLSHISDYHQFSVSPAHNRPDGVKEYIYVSKYLNTLTEDNKLKSITGTIPQRGNYEYFDNLITNSGLDRTHYGMMDFATLVTIWFLYLVEFADWDSCETIGFGQFFNSDSNINKTGYTDILDFITGSVILPNSKYDNNSHASSSVKYLGIENLWSVGQYATWVSGIKITDNEEVHINLKLDGSDNIFIQTLASNYHDNVFYTYGHNNGHTGLTNLYSNNYDWVLLPPNRSFKDTTVPFQLASYFSNVNYGINNFIASSNNVVAKINNIGMTYFTSGFLIDFIGRTVGFDKTYIQNKSIGGLFSFSNQNTATSSNQIDKGVCRLIKI